jgi:hypothetical protein
MSLFLVTIHQYHFFCSILTQLLHQAQLACLFLHANAGIIILGKAA